MHKMTLIFTTLKKKAFHFSSFTSLIMLIALFYMAYCLTLYNYFVNYWVLSILISFNSIPRKMLGSKEVS